MDLTYICLDETIHRLQQPSVFFLDDTDSGAVASGVDPQYSHDGFWFVVDGLPMIES